MKFPSVASFIVQLMPRVRTSLIEALNTALVCRCCLDSLNVIVKRPLNCPTKYAQLGANHKRSHNRFRGELDGFPYALRYYAISVCVCEGRGRGDC